MRMRLEKVQGQKTDAPSYKLEALAPSKQYPLGNGHSVLVRMREDAESRGIDGKYCKYCFEWTNT
jgi:hypothetical protein